MDPVVIDGVWSSPADAQDKKHHECKSGVNREKREIPGGLAVRQVRLQPICTACTTAHSVFEGPQGEGPYFFLKDSMSILEIGVRIATKRLTSWQRVCPSHENYSSFGFWRQLSVHDSNQSQTETSGNDFAKPLSENDPVTCHDPVALYSSCKKLRCCQR